MNTGSIEDSRILDGSRVCPWQRARHFDNFLRPLIHKPAKLFGPYVRPGMTVLDVGCGGGFASLGLARLVGKDGLVFSADLQPEMLEIVHERATGAGLLDRIRLHRCEPDRIGLEARVDFAVAFYMVHEVPDSRAFLAEVCALLNPGGRFFIAEPKVHTSRSDFERLLEEARETGFSVMGTPKARLSRTVVLEKVLAAGAGS